MNTKCRPSAPKYAQELQRNIGLDKAIKLAKRCYDSSKPDVLASLPTGPVFFNKDHRGNTTLNSKHYSRLNGFWEQVYNVLKKYK